MKHQLRSRRQWILTITVILCAEVFVADLVLPLGLAIWLPYGALVLISLWAPHRKYTYAIAIACTALILLAGFLSSFGLRGPQPLDLFDRGLGMLLV